MHTHTLYTCIYTCIPCFSEEFHRAYRCEHTLKIGPFARNAPSMYMHTHTHTDSHRKCKTIRICIYTHYIHTCIPCFSEAFYRAYRCEHTLKIGSLTYTLKGSPLCHCVCAYVCMYMYVCICMCSKSDSAHTPPLCHFIYAYVCIYVCVYVCMCVCM